LCAGDVDGVERLEESPLCTMIVVAIVVDIMVVDDALMLLLLGCSLLGEERKIERDRRTHAIWCQKTSKKPSVSDV
jgi:hypothetical protein